jgi:two-component system phosphate regulon response regulator PhoB
MGKEHILVVEDEEDILEMIRFNLAKEGYKVTTCSTGEQAVSLAAGRHPDLVLLDLMLPGMDGFEVCRHLQRDPTTQSIPIVMLTAKGEEADVVAGLELGAEDYITKPFSPRVLAARLRHVLRRKSRPEPAGNDIIRIHGLVINPGRHEVLLKGKPLDLSFTEFRVLQVLASRPGWVFTRQQIVDQVRGDDYPVTERSVDVQIVGLRKKLGSACDLIETVRGVGYRFQDKD